MNIRIKLIQVLININEQIFFYPKLKTFYKNQIKITPPLPDSNYNIRCGF